MWSSDSYQVLSKQLTSYTNNCLCGRFVLTPPNGFKELVITVLRICLQKEYWVPIRSRWEISRWETIWPWTYCKILSVFQIVEGDVSEVQLMSKKVVICVARKCVKAWSKRRREIKHRSLGVKSLFGNEHAMDSDAWLEMTVLPYEPDLTLSRGGKVNLAAWVLDWRTKRILPVIWVEKSLELDQEGYMTHV